jgi:hypothetical protein
LGETRERGERDQTDRRTHTHTAHRGDYYDCIENRKARLHLVTFEAPGSAAYKHTYTHRHTDTHNTRAHARRAPRARLAPDIGHQYYTAQRARLHQARRRISAWPLP